MWADDKSQYGLRIQHTHLHTSSSSDEWIEVYYRAFFWRCVTCLDWVGCRGHRYQYNVYPYLNSSNLGADASNHCIQPSSIYLLCSKVYIYLPIMPPPFPSHHTIYRLSAGFCVPAFGFRGSFLNSSAGCRGLLARVEGEEEMKVGAIGVVWRV